MPSPAHDLGGEPRARHGQCQNDDLPPARHDEVDGLELFKLPEEWIERGGKRGAVDGEDLRDQIGAHGTRQIIGGFPGEAGGDTVGSLALHLSQRAGREAHVRARLRRWVRCRQQPCAWAGAEIQQRDSLSWRRHSRPNRLVSHAVGLLEAAPGGG